LGRQIRCLDDPALPALLVAEEPVVQQLFVEPPVVQLLIKATIVESITVITTPPISSVLPPFPSVLPLAGKKYVESFVL